MRKELKQLEEYIHRSRKILISSHLAPDHDSVASTLLLKHILDNHYPETSCEIVFERTWGNRRASLDMDLSEIYAGSEVDFSDFDLLIMVDVHQLERTFDVYAEEVEELESIAIDHHQLAPNISCDLLLHEEASSATAVVYNTFKEIHGDSLVVTNEMAHLVQIGILTDSARFLWGVSANTYRLMADMMDIEPVNNEKVWNDASKRSRKSLYLFNHLLTNSKFEGDMIYTYVDDENITDLDNYSHRDIQHAASLFLNDFFRTVEDVNWGFLVKGSTKSRTLWRVSFRASTGTENVLEYAEELGGGGYITAASGTVQADTPLEATVLVWEAINKVRSRKE